MRRTSVAALLAVLPAVAQAQGRMIPGTCAPPPCTTRECGDRPWIPCPPGTPIVRTSSHVRVEMVDRVLRYEVSETFVNRGGGLGQADYIFPLPKGAAFEDLKLSINGELVSGETMNAAEARRIYEEIVRKHRDPALVEWMGMGLLRTRVFPIQPGEEKRVVVRFQTVAEREGSALRIDYVRGTDPNTNFTPGPVPMPMPREATPRDRRPEPESGTTFTLTYPDARTYGRPYSPTHALSVNDRGTRRSVTATGDGREVTILLPLLRANEAAVSVLAHRPDDEDGFALITVSPPVARGRAMPRNVTFVVDVSGSMSGQKLAQAKAAGRALLSSLGATDRFRIIDFSTDVRSFRDEFVPATAANLRDAEHYLDDLRAEGSTNISGALDAALDAVRDENRLQLVVFVTDGEPTVGERNPDAIAARAARRRGETRIFSVGVSAEVNATLIEQLAVEGHGTAHFVRAGESVERAVSLLAARLTTPVLTNVRVHVDGVRLRQLHPVLPVDLFAGQDLVLLARYDGDGEARIRVEGRALGGPMNWTTTATFPRRARENPFVPRLWAAQRLGWLAAEKRKNGGTTELDGEIRSLGERYGIPTEFSSYLVLEPGMQDMLGQRVARANRTRPGAASPAPTVARDEAQRAATGQSANEFRFEQARQAAAQREAKSLAEVDVASGGMGQTASMRQVGPRQFLQQGNVWTDQRYTPTQRTVQVKAFSPLYFELVSKLTGLKDALALGEEVLVAGRSVAIQVGPAGLEKLTERELADLVRAW
ncbi:MAG TPA: VIT domain-containing protein [Gemmatimonadaceae bacterium]|nr:VIT domain-containing protein [Gemmatimonadaceae bacterium]